MGERKTVLPSSEFYNSKRSSYPLSTFKVDFSQWERIPILLPFLQSKGKGKAVTTPWILPGESKSRSFLDYRNFQSFEPLLVQILGVADCLIDWLTSSTIMIAEILSVIFQVNKELSTMMSLQFMPETHIMIIFLTCSWALVICG